jgi:hypothetical protein
MTMLITNLTNQEYYFGPLHLPAGNGSTLNVDDTSATSLYLTDDVVADAINTLFASNPAKITVSGQALPFPRATGEPAILHGDGSPDGIVYAPQGSLYIRRDAPSTVYQKSTGLHVNTGWSTIAGSVGVVTSLPASPSNGQKVLLRLGSSPYTFLEMTYDATYGHWVSAEFNLGGGNVDVMAGYGMTDHGFGAFSLAPATAGLTFQLKGGGLITGTGNNEIATAYFQILQIATNGSAAWTSGIWIGNGNENTTTYVAINWTTMALNTGYDVGVCHAELYTPANWGSFRSMGALGRWIA